MIIWKQWRFSRNGYNLRLTAPEPSCQSFLLIKPCVTKEHCIPDDHKSNIVGKVVVLNAETKRYEYQHPAYQLILTEGGSGATGGRGQAVFGTCLATGERARWERYDVLGEIKPECMPEKPLPKSRSSKKLKRRKSRTVGRNTDMEIRALTLARTQIHLCSEYAASRADR